MKIPQYKPRYEQHNYNMTEHWRMNIVYSKMPIYRSNVIHNNMMLTLMYQQKRDDFKFKQLQILHMKQ